MKQSSTTPLSYLTNLLSSESSTETLFLTPLIPLMLRWQSTQKLPASMLQTDISWLLRNGTPNGRCGSQRKYLGSGAPTDCSSLLRATVAQIAGYRYLQRVGVATCDARWHLPPAILQNAGSHMPLTAARLSKL